jgi:diaminopimelate epimerase
MPSEISAWIIGMLPSHAARQGATATAEQQRRALDEAQARTAAFSRELTGTRSEIEILIWERGAGETLASGSSSCAVAAAAHRLGAVDGKVTVRMPGGALRIEIGADYALRMTGPATPVYRGALL